MIPQASNAAIAVMTKAPNSGVSKTRLVSGLPALQARELIERVLAASVENAASCDVDVYVIVRGDVAATRAAVNRWATRDLSNVRYLLSPTRGHVRALRETIRRLLGAGYGKVVAVPSDAPTLDCEYLIRSIDRLNSADYCVGPSADGGVVLLGARSPLPEDMRGRGSSSSLFDDASNSLEAGGFVVSRLAERVDLDDRASLALAIDRDELAHADGLDRFLTRALDEMTPARPFAAAAIFV